MRIAAVVLALMALISSGNAQAWRNCIQNSIGPGGCKSIGPGGGQSIGPEAGPQSAQAADFDGRGVASLLGQEGAYRSDPAGVSGQTEIGAEGSTPGSWAEAAVSFPAHAPSSVADR